MECTSFEEIFILKQFLYTTSMQSRSNSFLLSSTIFKYLRQIERHLRFISLITRAFPYYFIQNVFWLFGTYCVSEHVPPKQYLNADNFCYNNTFSLFQSEKCRLTIVKLIVTLVNRADNNITEARLSIHISNVFLLP